MDGAQGNQPNSGNGRHHPPIKRWLYLWHFYFTTVPHIHVQYRYIHSERVLGHTLICLFNSSFFSRDTERERTKEDKTGTVCVYMRTYIVCVWFIQAGYSKHTSREAKQRMSKRKEKRRKIERKCPLTPCTHTLHTHPQSNREREREREKGRGRGR